MVCCQCLCPDDSPCTVTGCCDNVCFNLFINFFNTNVVRFQLASGSCQCCGYTLGFSVNNNQGGQTGRLQGQMYPPYMQQPMGGSFMTSQNFTQSGEIPPFSAQPTGYPFGYPGLQIPSIPQTGHIAQ